MPNSFCISLTLLLFSIHFTQVSAQSPQSFKNHGPGGGGYTYVPSISPYDPDLIYLNCDMGGVYRSTDGAETWQLLPSNNLVSQVKGKVQFTSDPNVLYVCRRSTTNLNDPLYRGELAKSLDAGLTWQPLADPTGSGVHRLEVDPNSTQRLLLNEYDRLFFSSDGGATWSQIYQPPSGNMWLGGAFWDGNNIYVGTNEGLLVSKNGGASFNIETHGGLPAGAGIYHLSGAKSGNTVRLFCLPVPATELFAWGEPLSVRDKLQGLYKMDYATTANWGNSRGNIPSSEEIAWVDLANGNTQTVWAAAATADGTPKVYKSTNGGSNWTNTYLLDNNQNLSTGWTGNDGAFWLYYNDTALGLEVAPTDPNKVIIADGTGHITTDGGATWRATYVDAASRNVVGQPSTINQFYKTSGLDVTTAHHIFWQNDSSFFVCNTDIGQTYSQDAGEHWTFAHNIFHDYGPVANNNWYRIVRQPTTGHLFAALAELNDMYMPQRITDEVLDGTGGLVAKSEDGGMTWDTIFNFGHPVVWLEVDKMNPSKLYASVVHSTEGGVYQSTDGGNSWSKLPEPPRTQGHPYNLVSLDDGSLVTTYAAKAEFDGTFLTETSGVFLLPPGADAWLDRTDVAMKFYTKDLVVDPHDPSQNTWYATVWGRFTTFAGPNNQGNGGLYRTTDRGQTWTRVFANELAESITIHPTTPGTAYLSAENDGLYYTENLGGSPSFERVEAFPFWRPKRVFFHPNFPHEVWVTTMGGGIWSSAGQVPGHVDYSPMDEDFPNPERGFYHYTETSSSNHVPLDLDELVSWRTPHQPFGANYSVVSTLAFRYFVLEDFANGPISQAFLDDIAGDFAIARQAGVKLIPRFVYTLEGEDCGGTYCTPYGDAPKAVVLQHIAQLKPILQANADVIAALQFGFVGIWGEGYYTDHFGDASQPPFGLTAQNWADRNEVIAALLDALPSSRCLQVRYPQQKQKMVHGVNAPVTAAPLTEAEAFQNTAKARIGHHNDCFLSSANDIGTYENYDTGNNGFDTLHFKPYLAADSRFVPVGGETCSDWNPYSNCNEQPGGGAQSEMERMHWSFLNADYNHALNNDWTTGGCMEEIKQRLGYRLELQNGEYPTEAQPGQSISLKINLKNKGFAAPYNARAAWLLLRNNGTGGIWRVALPDDPRTWLAGEQVHAIEHSFCLPTDLPLGNYELLLHLADPFPSLADRPEYAIRLANDGVWEANTGYNKLLHQIEINGTAFNALCAGEDCLQPLTQLPPTAGFSANVQSGCAPLTVAFSTVQNPCMNYDWSFPGGTPSTSTLNSASVVYGTPGSYLVELTVSNAAGMDTKTEADFIQVQGLPTPMFSFTTNGLSANLDNQSLNATSYYWSYYEDDTSDAPFSTTATEPNFYFPSPGVYSVTLSAYNSCGWQSITLDITVSCLPSEISITPSGPLEICQGDTLQLKASTSHYYYRWYLDGQLISIETDSFFQATQAGTYQVVANAVPGCADTSNVLIVTEQPFLSASIDTAVNGTAITLTATGLNTTSYAWDFGKGQTATGPIATHDFGVYGNFPISLVIGNDCFSDTLEIVFQNPAPPLNVAITANGDTEFCEGESVLLLVEGGGFDYCEWYYEGALILDALGENYLATVPGTYNAACFMLNGQSGISNEIEVIVHPNPQVELTGLSLIYEDDDPAVPLSGTPPGGIFGGNGVTGNQFDPAMAGIGEHWVHYSFTDAFGCTGADSMLVVVTMGTATFQIEGIAKMAIVPNPTSGKFWLELDLWENKWLKIRLLNLVGQVLEERQEGFQSGHSSVPFDAQGLDSGMYFLEISKGEQRATFRVVLIK